MGLATSALALGLGIAAPGAAFAAPAPVSGSSSNPELPPNDMVEGIDYWHNMQWPNWRNIGNREWFEVAHWEENGNGQTHHEMVFTGGQFFDRDGALRNFMNNGPAPSSSHGYTGSFQEYNTTIYDRVEADDIPRRDARRIIRAIGTGDMFWTTDHYATFHYAGRS
ncbi:hypothetical protein [Streptomyces graminilatus]|uniref:hypothetical protein n=1 Tax=Streptomyces graminilatus TaxID=1464070 RepID=UPI0006E278A0|nr:hypothetical protein [Streptomyces graminilatus]